MTTTKEVEETKRKTTTTRITETAPIRASKIKTASMGAVDMAVSMADGTATTTAITRAITTTAATTTIIATTTLKVGLVCL